MEYVLPSTIVQQTLVYEWKNVLGVERGGQLSEDTIKSIHVSP